MRTEDGDVRIEWGSTYQSALLGRWTRFKAAYIKRNGDFADSRAARKCIREFVKKEELRSKT